MVSSKHHHAGERARGLVLFMLRKNLTAWILALASICVLLVIVLISCTIEERVQITPMPQDSAGTKRGEIYGRVMRASDVQTIPDTTIQNALVLAIRSGRTELLLSEVTETEKIDNLWNAHFSINEELFNKYVEEFAISQQDGTYGLEVKPGEYLLCLANLSPGSEMFPANVRGCVEVVVPEEDKPLNKDIFWWGYSGSVTSP